MARNRPATAVDKLAAASALLTDLAVLVNDGGITEHQAAATFRALALEDGGLKSTTRILSVPTHRSK
jgi:hypothetical protein